MKTGEELQVGCECIKKFGINDMYYISDFTKSSMNSMITELAMLQMMSLVILRNGAAERIQAIRMLSLNPTLLWQRKLSMIFVPYIRREQKLNTSVIAQLLWMASTLFE